MRNSMKVAKWEVKRNLKSKSFIIGLPLTPLIVVGIWFFGGLFSDDESPETILFVNGELGVFDQLAETIESYDLGWQFVETDLTIDEIDDELESGEDTAYLFLTQEGMENGTIPVYTTEEIDSSFSRDIQLLGGALQTMRVAQLDLTEEEMAVVLSNITIEEVSAEDMSAAGTEENIFEQLVPGIFAVIILFSIVGSGMMIFQSASNEKKDKIAEIILSSVTHGELMNGKIIGYFILGIIQTAVLLIFVGPYVIYQFDIPVLEYLLVPETVMPVFIAILGYLLYAAIYAGLGATMADMSTTSNFQGFIMMLPFLSFVLMPSVFRNPDGMIASIGSIIPFTSPGVLVVRLSVVDEWPWVELLIGIAVLIISIILLMKLAGKIFKVGMLMYGKNASPSEIWKWVRT